MLERIARAGLVLVVAALAVLVLANYWIASRQFQRGLETQLDQQLNQLATSLVTRSGPSISRPSSSSARPSWPGRTWPAWR